MTEYSAPRVGVTKYTIYPTGYDQAPWSDGGGSFCCYVEQFPDTGRWYVNDGFRPGYVSTHKAKWVRNIGLNRQWTRFDTAEEAIEVALRAVDTRYEQEYALVNRIEHWNKMQAEKETSVS